MSQIHFAILQMPGFDTKEKSFDAYATKIHEAASNNVDCVIFPELHNHLYFAQTQNPDFFKLAETIPGDSTDFYSQLAKQHQVVIVTSLFEKRSHGLYHNTAVVIDKDGTIRGKYRKMHIPDDPGFNEKYYFTPGDLGFKPIQTSIGRLGVLICWDQWFPEAARLMALNGADCLIYPTAIGFQTMDTPEEQKAQLSAWQTIQRSHAIANGLPVLVANRVGHEVIEGALPEGITFWGNSFACDQMGGLLSQGDDQTKILYATINKEKSEATRQAWPFFRDRRIEHYQALNQIFSDQT